MKIYHMNDICKKENISYETLRFYCNEGLVPNIKRDKNNYRIFNEQQVQDFHGIIILRKCGMSLDEIRRFPNLHKNTPLNIRKKINQLIANKTRLDELAAKAKAQSEFLQSTITRLQKQAKEWDK